MLKFQKIFLFTLSILFVHSQYPPHVQSCCQNNQIQVSGQGKASALPDMATISLRFLEKGKNSADAVRALSRKVTLFVNVLKSNGYRNDAYDTGSLSVYPEYNYQVSPAEVIGYQAQQTISVKVLNVDSKGQKVGTLIDALAKVDSINIDSVTFDIFDKTELQEKARADAFKNAQQKATDYAEFAGRRLGKVVTIDDSSYVDAAPIALSPRVEALKSFASQTSVPLGTQDVSYRTTITFALR